jgi:hypothetical protein
MEGDIHALHTRRVVGYAHPPSSVIVRSMLDDQALTDSVDSVVCFGNSVQLVMVWSKPPAGQTASLMTVEITDEFINQRNGL